MAIQMLTDNMRTKAERLADESDSWLRATSRVNGQSFYIVPSSDGSAAHYTNRFGCTCEGFRRRGVCAHNEAAKIIDRRVMNERVKAAQPKWEERRAEVRAGLPKFKRGYRDLFPIDDDF